VNDGFLYTVGFGRCFWPLLPLRPLSSAPRSLTEMQQHDLGGGASFFEPPPSVPSQSGSTAEEPASPYRSGRGGEGAPSPVESRQLPVDRPCSRASAPRRCFCERAPPAARVAASQTCLCHPHNRNESEKCPTQPYEDAAGQRHRFSGRLHPEDLPQNQTQMADRHGNQQPLGDVVLGP